MLLSLSLCVVFCRCNLQIRASSVVLLMQDSRLKGQKSQYGISIKQTSETYKVGKYFFFDQLSFRVLVLIRKLIQFQYCGSLLCVMKWRFIVEINTFYEFRISLVSIPRLERLVSALIHHPPSLVHRGMTIFVHHYSLL